MWPVYRSWNSPSPRNEPHPDSDLDSVSAQELTCQTPDECAHQSLSLTQSDVAGRRRLLLTIYTVLHATGGCARAD